MGCLDEVIQEFLIESYENLDQLSGDVLILEKTPQAKDVLDGIFRTVHTIKGTCVFLGFKKLEAFAHVAENMLGRLRDGELSFNAEVATLLLKMEKDLRRAIQYIEENKVEEDNDFALMRDAINKYMEEAKKNGQREITEIVATTPEVVVEEVKTSSPIEKNTGEQQSKESKSGGASDSTIRIDVELLDRLMNLVGELVLTRNQVLQFTNSQEDSALISAAQRLSVITSELQEGVMKTRMQPIANVWNKFPRIVRDLSVSCGKQIRVDMEDQETELDKTIIEAIKDPLTHIIRNAVDHGIETPEQRVAVGKPPEGVISLRAFHEGGQVNIEISDDGRGISPEKIKAKALERGLFSREELSKMSDRDALHMVFLPGFSTAEKITNISGRGVGMDVVKTNLEKIGGSVDIQSRVGFGSVLKIKIPLTLAIIPALIVGASGQRFAIPQINLLELVRLDGESAKKGIEMVHGAPVYRLRGNILPLVSLKQELDVRRQTVSLINETEQGLAKVYIVVLQAESRQFGLVVDEIFDAEEIVVKPLSKQLKCATTFAGATIMGDGKVALILDVIGVAQRAHVISENKVGNGLSLDRTSRNHVSSEFEDNESLLLVGVGNNQRLAIPLSKVERLEEFSEKDIEQGNQQSVVQYRGGIMRLVNLSSAMGYGTSYHEGNAEENTVSVVVYNDGQRDVGFIVDKVIDIVREKIVVLDRGARSGIHGSVVLQGKVTDLLDVKHLSELSAS